jgi:flagellar biosynthesis protein FlhF
VHCKNYRAYTMAEAMAAVKADLGPDAVVLHTRTMMQGGFLGIGRKTVIEITAARAEEADRSAPASRTGEASSRATKETPAAAARQPSIRGGVANRAYGESARAARSELLDASNEDDGGSGSPLEPLFDGRFDATSETPFDRQFDPKFDRDRTRLLAQAMAVKLEREREQAPRTSAGTAAAANAAATSVAAQRDAVSSPRSSAPVAPISKTNGNGNGNGSGSNAPTSGNSNGNGVAQRFVLIPADDPRRTSDRQTLIHRVTAPPIESVAAPRTPVSQPLPTAKAPPQAPPAPQAPAPPQAPVAPPSPVTQAAPRAPIASGGVELVDIDRLVEEVLRRPSSANGARGQARPQRLESLYANLISQELGNELADAIITDLHASLTADELASDHAVRSAAMQRIAALLPIGGGLEPAIGPMGWRRDGRALTVAFVGPTGVGKTTTVAKIAASLKLRHGARVGLITCDTYRIAAVDQLRTYAEIIGLPLEVALSPGQMRQARQRLNDLDVILIDTAGRSQNDADRIGELAAMVKAAEPHETHLVLSSVASEKVLLREAQAFSTVGVNRVVLTKLDEAAGLGAVLRVVRQIGRGVSYITTGQEVPQHLESARPSRLAELVLGGAPSA